MTQDPKQMRIKVIEITEKELEAALQKSKEKMDRARTRLLMKREFRFFATLALHLEPVPALGLGTCATDGTHLLYDPLKIASDDWSLDELIGVNAHEALHCALLHHARLGARDPFKFNIACDKVINAHLDQNGFSLPKPDKDFPPNLWWQKGDEKYSAEQMYDRIKLPQNMQPQPGDGQGQPQDGQQGDDRATGEYEGQPVYDPTGHGGIIQPRKKPGEEGDGAAAAQAKAQERKWTIIAKQAAAIAQAQGTLPGGFEGLLEPTRSPIDPWSILRQFVDLCRAEDYSYSRPNRRFVGEDLFLPTLYSEGIGELLIGVDTSGSVSDKQLAAALGFVAAVVADVKPERVHVLQCDAGVHSHTIYGDGVILPGKVKVTGRGGTSMAPLWPFAAKNDIHPVVGIVLTDMEMSASDFGKSQEFPILWLNLGRDPNAKAPFGDTVYVELPA